MEKEPLIKLTWQGDATVARIASLLNQAERIDVALPAEYNHTLFRILHPDADVAAVEAIDIDAAPEILDAIAKIRGLESLASLTAVLTRAKASVSLFSPPTLVIYNPSERHGRSSHP